MSPDDISEMIDAFIDGDEDGDASPSGNLQEWLSQDEAHVDVFVQHMFIHKRLKSLLDADRTVETPESDDQKLPTEKPKPIVFPGKTFFGLDGSWANLLLILLAASVLVTSGFYLGRNIDYTKVSTLHHNELSNLANEDQHSVARLVKTTNCLWDSVGDSSVQLKTGASLQAGESLNLLEGVAEIKSALPDGTIGQFILEGPVSLVMTNRGIPRLQFGKLSVTVDGKKSCVAIDTALGSFASTPTASFGVMSNGSNVDLHVFSGDVTFDRFQLYGKQDKKEPVKAQAGTSLQLSLTPENTVAVHEGKAADGDFITQGSLSASELSITADYVAAIKRSKPIAYWRFDRVGDGKVLNEMGSDHVCLMEGPVRIHKQPSGNYTAEFGSARPSFLVTDDKLADNLAHGLTVEFWVKPSYFQTATVFSLDKVGTETLDTITSDRPDLTEQGMMLELTGPSSNPSDFQQSRVRFLHRNPPSRDRTAGISCFSDQPYTPRVWQHVAAVKSNDVMTLYIDGAVAASGRDAMETANGMRVLIGQLYYFTTGANRGVRPFVGELAEIALYDHPLSSAEIKRHIKLARSQVNRDSSS